MLSYMVSQQTQNICITCIQFWTNVEDVGPTLYKCYANVLCFLGRNNMNFHIQNLICLQTQPEWLDEGSYCISTFNLSYEIKLTDHPAVEIK